MLKEEELKQSSAVKGFSYNRTEKILTIEFTKGSMLYHYQGVELKTWIHFLRHSSISTGQSYHLFIKDRFEFIKEKITIKSKEIKEKKKTHLTLVK